MVHYRDGVDAACLAGGREGWPVDDRVRRVVGVYVKIDFHGLDAAVCEQRLPDDHAVRRADLCFGSALRVWHHPQHVSLRVAYPGYVLGRAVRIEVRQDAPLGRAVAEHYLALALHLLEHVGRDLVVAFVVRDRDAQDLPLVRRGGPWSIDGLDPDVHEAADELQADVAHDGPGEEPRLHQDLEPVADADDHATALGELLHRAHHGREARHSTGPQVIPVREPAGQHQAVVSRDIRAAVPHVIDVLLEHAFQDIVAVVVAVRPGKDDDPEPHQTSTSIR